MAIARNFGRASGGGLYWGDPGEGRRRRGGRGAVADFGIEVFRARGCLLLTRVDLGGGLVVFSVLSKLVDWAEQIPHRPIWDLSPF